jgi:hypothetical protein
MVFSRSSNGTRVNFDGLVEVCPWNLLQQSENVPNAVWGKSTLTFNSTVTAPNGTSTAQNYSTAGAYSYAIQTITVSSGEYYTVSCYLKYTSGVGGISIGYTDAPSVNFIRVDANLINGTIGSVSYGGNGANGTATITSVGDGWYRVTVSGTLTIGTAGLIFSNLALGATTFSVWGGQLNIGSTAKPYFPTTDRLNVPRLTYPNGGGGCPSLLLEKQSTNLVTYSEQFDNAAWTLDGDGVGQSVTANYSTSPDGTQNADRLQLNKTGGTYSRIRQDKSGAGTYAWTVYMKSNTSNNQNVGLRLDNTAINCVVTPTWQRFTLNATVGTPQSQILLFDSIVGNDETADISIWGAQLEASSYPTSYIPTTSASATRVSDACTKTGASALIGQSEGTIFLDFVVNGQSVAANAINIYNNDFSATTISTIAITYVNGTLGAYSFLGNGTFDNVGIIGTGYSIGQRIKLAYRYKSGDFALYINGVQKQTSSTTMTFNGTKTEIYLNALNVYYGYPDAVQYNEFVQFTTGLSNSELQALTS